ncbi:MAG TPA: L,D-transpeptidase [Rhizomicrobium sp.]
MAKLFPGTIFQMAFCFYGVTPAKAGIAMRKWAVGVLFVAAAMVPAFAFNPGAKTSSVAQADINKLRPGQFIWALNLAPAGPLTIVVNLPSQLLYVYRNGVRIGASTVSSGMRRHETPTGIFMILQKAKEHRSTIYNSASMPFMQRLTWDGVALHAGGVPGFPTSHGCVHLPLTFSELLFKETGAGATVIITNDAPTVRNLLSPGVLNPARAPDDPGYTAADQLAANEDFRWQPYRSETGPVTIIMSAADQRVYVLRSGIVIGRARVALQPGAIKGTHALSFTGFDEKGQAKWLYVGLPGDDDIAAKPLDMVATKKVRIPPEFYNDVRDILMPGTNMVVTEDSMEDGSPGTPITVFANS